VLNCIRDVNESLLALTYISTYYAKRITNRAIDIARNLRKVKPASNPNKNGELSSNNRFQKGD